MTHQELQHVIEQFKTGKIYYSQETSYTYSGDINVKVIRYDVSRACFLWEIYHLHGNGEEQSRSEAIIPEKLDFYLGGDYQKALDKLVDHSQYPFVG